MRFERFCLEQNEKEKQPGKGPEGKDLRTFEE